MARAQHLTSTDDEATFVPARAALPSDDEATFREPAGLRALVADLGLDDEATRGPAVHIEEEADVCTAAHGALADPAPHRAIAARAVRHDFGELLARRMSGVALEAPKVERVDDAVIASSPKRAALRAELLMLAEKAKHPDQAVASDDTRELQPRSTEDARATEKRDVVSFVEPTSFEDDLAPAPRGTSELGPERTKRRIPVPVVILSLGLLGIVTATAVATAQLLG